MYCDFPTMNTLFVLGQSSRYAFLQKYKGLVISTVVFFLMTYPIHELDCCNEGVWKLGYLDFSDRSTLESIMRNYACHGQHITYVFEESRKILLFCVRWKVCNEDCRVLSIPMWYTTIRLVGRQKTMKTYRFSCTGFASSMSKDSKPRNAIADIDRTHQSEPSCFPTHPLQLHLQPSFSNLQTATRPSHLHP